MAVLVLANIIIAVATVAQRATGLGFSLIAVPLLALLIGATVVGLVAIALSPCP